MYSFRNSNYEKCSLLELRKRLIGDAQLVQGHILVYTLHLMRIKTINYLQLLKLILEFRV